MIIVLVTLALGSALVRPALAQQGSGKGYWYTVRTGDSWWSISAQTGIPVGALQAVNPQAIHPNLWLWRGERLWIPSGRSQSRQRGYWYLVQEGDSWLDLAIRTGVSVTVLKRLNPQAVHPHDWMWAGDRIFIPSGPAPSIPAPPTKTPFPVPTPPVAPAATAIPTKAAVPAATPTPTLAAKPTRSASPTSEQPRRGTSVATRPALDVRCPVTAKEAVQAVGRAWSAAGGKAGRLQDWMRSCGLAPEVNTVLTADVNGDGQSEVALILKEPHQGKGPLTEALFIFHLRGNVWTPLYRQDLGGVGTLLAFDDINGDGHTDVVWKEKSCDILACSTTVNVLSWHPQEATFTSFSEGAISMPNADVRLADVTSDPGKEIVLHGGVIEAIGAGPQRSWTDIWASKDSGPYQLVRRRYDPSPCLYHWVLDGNAALKAGRFDDAIAIFQKVVSDTSLQACWLRANEETELRSFGWFRLALSYAYAGRPQMVKTVVHQAQQMYADAPYIQALTLWYQHYSTSHDPVQACKALGPTVERNSLLWEMLADYGMANPTFGPGDVCPVVHVKKTSEGQGGCPDTLKGAVAKALHVLDAAPGDILGAYNALRKCGYISDTYGGIGGQDIDRDGDEDVFLALDLPSAGKAQPTSGILAALHRQGEVYTVTMQQPFSATVSLLALEDLNQDGQGDVVWKTTNCSSLKPRDCEVGIHVASWTGQAYASWVKGTIQGHNARVEFADEGPGAGQEIVLTENAYTEHPATLPQRTQIWASDKGTPYTLYDVRYEGTTCARYALDEAEVAFRTASRYGWDRAFSRLQRVLNDSTLTACRQGGNPDAELALIRSLADFYLAQAYAHNGRFDRVQTTVQTLLHTWPHTPLAPLVRAWWTSFQKNRDTSTACRAALGAIASRADLLAALEDYPLKGLGPRDLADLCVK